MIFVLVEKDPKYYKKRTILSAKEICLWDRMMYKRISI